MRRCLGLGVVDGGCRQVRYRRHAGAGGHGAAHKYVVAWVRGSGGQVTD